MSGRSSKSLSEYDFCSASVGWTKENSPKRSIKMRIASHPVKSLFYRQKKLNKFVRQLVWQLKGNLPSYTKKSGNSFVLKSNFYREMKLQQFRVLIIFWRF